MSAPAPATGASPHAGMSFREFVAFLAACMALNALSIDVMIPALGEIAREFALADPNARQDVIILYVLGMSVSQLFYGPLADRYGRKPVLLGGLLLYVAAGLAATLANSFPTLLAARVLQGFAAGSPRVVALSLARDCYGGARMAQLMSLVMMVFMVVPVLAPSLGQLILTVAPWRAIFGVLVAGGALVIAWTVLRLPETLRPEYRRGIAAGDIARGMAAVFRHPASAGYTLAVSIMTGMLLAFIATAQQIFVDVYALDGRFTLLFGAMALCMSAAAYANSRLVLRFGLRRMSHGALALFAALSLVYTALAARGELGLPAFLILQTLSMCLFGFIGANFNVLALEPMAHVAGTASSTVGFVTTALGGVLGYAVAQRFDGSVLPLAAGNLALAIGAALCLFVALRRART